MQEKEKKMMINEKIERESQNQENGSITKQEMILGLITFKHIFWAYLSFLS